MKNKGLSLLLLLLGGAAVYYYYKNNKTKKLRGSVIVDPLDKGEFVPDVAQNTLTTEQIVTQLNSEMLPNTSILSQIQQMNPVDTITYQTYYAKIGGQKMGVPYSI
jgi:hypothetical protein